MSYFHTSGSHASARMVAVVAFLLIPITGSLHAQGVSEAQKDALRSSCRSDFMANCSGVQPGGTEALQCLESHMAKLSAPCQGAVKSVMPKSAPATPAVTKQPASPPPAAATSPAPAPSAPAPSQTTEAAPAPTQEQAEAVRVTCRRDYRRLCRGVPQGPEALACLQRNTARLTPNCRTSVAAIGNPQVTPPPPGQHAPLVTRRMAMQLPIRLRAAIVAACEPDRRTVCGRARLGEGRVIVCLAENISTVSANCREALVGAFP